ncbi:MAG: EAL domain-containing protein [Candidatus Eremiobacteraeota bacterium]|nr:EAL domain-containing protein [Candidatus Eremiobacteraeota bacterium]
MLLPTLVVAGAYVQAVSVRIAHTSDERMGVTVVRGLCDLIAAADGYRIARTSQSDIRRHAAQVDAAVAALERLDRGLPERVRLGADLAGVEREWTVIERLRSPSEARLSGWIERLGDTISIESDRSRITYDPGNDTINLGDALAIQFTRASVRFARLADVIDRTGASAAPLARRFLIARLASEALDRERIGISDLNEAMTVAPALVPALAVKSASVNRATSAYVERVRDAFVNGLSTRPRKLAAQGRRIVAEQRTLKTHLAALLDAALADRNWQERKMRATALAATILFGVLSFAIVAALMRSLALAGQLERIKSERARDREISAVQRELLTAEEKFRVTFEQTPVGILIVDEDLKTLQSNPALEALVPDVATLLAAESASFERALVSGENQRFERRYRRRDDQFAWAEVVLRGVSGGGAGRRYVLGTFRDVTESKALASRLLHDATHDALTGLPNRTYFQNALRSALEGSRANAAERWALLFLDLDDFKLINDSVGHHAGDAVLIATANRLRATLREGDVICRLSGDEFAIVLPYESDRDIERVAGRIVAVLAEPVTYEDSSLNIRTSVGIVVLGAGTMPAEDALRAADTAMYQAKTLGGGRFVLFDASLHERAKRRKRLTTDLRLALATRAIDVAYQPIVDLRSGRVLGFEALARWAHPTEGSVSPVEFVPIAEESGTIERLGAHVLLVACEQLAAWRRHDPTARDWTISINVAARQILTGSIVEDLRQALSLSGVPASRIVLELTESVLIDHVGQANETLEALRRLGVGMCIDDFGTGYSSLQYLQRFPVDGIKIDRSFVSNGEEGLASEPIVQMLVTLSRVLNLHIVVEGIETETQLQRLIALGCTAGQGYLFSRPIAADLAAAYADATPRLSAVS